MTSFLIDALQRPDRSDKDRDGRLSVADTMEWLRARTREYNAGRNAVDQVDIPILYGEVRGDVFLTPELRTSEGARATAAIRQAAEEVRSVFSAGHRLNTTTLERLARPISTNAPTITNLSVLDDFLRHNDDAALFCAAIAIYVRRDSSYASALVAALGPHLRDAALWRILRALRRILKPEMLSPELKDVLVSNLRSVARDPGRGEALDFGPNSVFGKILSLVDHLSIEAEGVFITGHLAQKVPLNKIGRPRPWSGKIYILFGETELTLKTSGETPYVDFLDEAYERLRAAGSQVTAHAYGVDWRLDASGIALPNLPPGDTTTLLDLSLRDNQTLRFVQLASDAKLQSRRAAAAESEGQT